MRYAIIVSLATISILLLTFSSVFGQQGFLLYENPDYNIKIQYPANWTKHEDNLPAQSPVYFTTPTQYSFQTPNATLGIFAFYYYSTLDSKVMSVKSSDQQRIQNGEIRVINYSYTILSGQRAWQRIYYDYSNDKSMREMVVLTVKDGEQYQIVFRAESGEFNRYLSIAEKMIQSFQITR